MMFKVQSHVRTLPFCRSLLRRFGDPEDPCRNRVQSKLTRSVHGHLEVLRNFRVHSDLLNAPREQILWRRTEGARDISHALAPFPLFRSPVDRRCLKVDDFPNHARLGNLAPLAELSHVLNSERFHSGKHQIVPRLELNSNLSCFHLTFQKEWVRLYFYTARFFSLRQRHF